MKTQKFQTVLSLAIIALALSACGPSAEELAATAVAETANAATSTPTITPTFTLTPTPTRTPIPTRTPTPTTLPFGRFVNPLINPANGHFYEAVTVSEGINWFDARAAAELRTFEGVQGHLATITSPEEDRFIARNFPEAVAHRFPDLPGGDITVAYWLGGFQSVGSGGEPLNDWQWVTGELFVYTNWAPGEPNQYKGNEEDCLHPHPDKGPLWNDSSCDRLWGGYVVEYDSTK